MNPWITYNIRHLIRSKTNYFNLYHLGHVTKSGNNLFKNKVKALIDQAKKSYYKNLFGKNRNDIRLLSVLLGIPWIFFIKKTKKSSALKSLIWNESEFTHDHDIAEVFSDYFSNDPVQLDSRV